MEQNVNTGANLDRLLRVSSSPHVRSSETVRRIMLDVIIALIPAAAVGIYFFGLNAALVLAIAVVSAVVAEAVFQKARHQDITISDLSAVVTGLLVGMNIPASAPWYLPAFGSIFAIIIAKQLFGGLGFNWVNPALAARAVLLISWPAQMTNFVAPLSDATSAATPLSSGQFPALMDMFIGNMPGTIGEVSAAALLLGGLYLVIRGVIKVHIPLIYIALTAGFLLLFGAPVDQLLYQILAGGLFLGAIFMATDYASSPLTVKGQIIFAVGAAFMTALIRRHGGMPEGVSYAILLMNVATPMIDKFTKPNVFGSVKHERKH